MDNTTPRANLPLETPTRSPKLAQHFPCELLRSTIPDFQRPTSVLSNLGVLFSGSALLGGDRRMVSGGVILENIEAVMPLLPLTHVAFVASNYGGKLNLTISHDPRWIDAAAAGELLESYVRQLTSSMELSNGKKKDSVAVVRAAAQRVVDEEPVKA